MIRSRSSQRLQRCVWIAWSSGLCACVQLRPVSGVLSGKLGNRVCTWGNCSRIFTRSCGVSLDWKSTRLNSSHLGISYAVFCLKKHTRTQPIKYRQWGEGLEHEAVQQLEKA